MKILRNKTRLAVYGCAGLGINLLNLIVGSYICSALLVGGFSETALSFHTYAQKDLVIVSIWGVCILITKLIDGIIDVPIGWLIDRIKNKYGRIKPFWALCIALTVLSFMSLLIIPSKQNLLMNTGYYTLVLGLFYISYTATMECFYSTFPAVAATYREKTFLANCKSIFDIVYFIVGYVLIAYFLTFSNIRIIALISATSSVTMLIPLFLLKESKGSIINQNKSYPSLIRACKVVLRDKIFMEWLCVFALMTFGVQLFLSGINEYFSYTGLNMIFTMACVFAPIPLTMFLQNKLVKKRGFAISFSLSLFCFSIGMFLLYVAAKSRNPLPISIIAGLIASFGVGNIFSVGYSIPAQFASNTNTVSTLEYSAMYFAIQGLFSAIAAGLAGGVLLTYLKQTGNISVLVVVSAITCFMAAILIHLLPSKLKSLGVNYE